MKSPAILDIVKDELDLDMPIEQLNEKLTSQAKKIHKL